MRSLLDGALWDFRRIPGLVQSAEWSNVVVQFSANPHARPKPLRDKQRVVYAFFQGTTWLRIGQTSYSPRSTSQHYGTRRAGSTLAKDIWTNKEDFGFVGNEEDIDAWIFSNVGRADIVLPAHWPAPVASLLEAYLHYRLNPRFEGRLNLCPKEVLDAVSRALATSRDWARGRRISNSTRSARFCSDVCVNLDDLLLGAKLTRRHIGVDSRGNRSSGEWLLDGTWTEDVTPVENMRKGVPARIRCAVECESSTAGYDYFMDFCKLLSIKSDVKLFLAGLNQRTMRGASRYVDKRVRQSNLLVRQYDATFRSDWYLAFWPSPLAVRGQSLWERIDNEDLTHLQAIVLYRYSDGAFKRIDGEAARQHVGLAAARVSPQPIG